MTDRKLPRVGQRILKSAAAVFLCYIIYLLRGRTGIAFYSMIGALYCIQPYTGKTRQMAVQRITGTVIGAVYGIIAIIFEIYVLKIYDTFPGYLFNAVFIIPLIYSTVLINKQNTSYFSCVVYLSIAVNHITDENPYMFVFNRVLDTFIGVAIGLAVNSARLPRRKVRDCLFVGELDDMLTPVKEELSSYSKIELNRMIDDGMMFTVSTMRTPASLMKPLEGVGLKLPVIAMDGAVLYDLKENTYLKAYVISHDSCIEIAELVRSEGMNCFINALYDDTLVIYYRELVNDAEKSLFKELKRSPYRNYIRRDPSELDRTIYIMILDRTEKINEFYDQFTASEYGERFKIIRYAANNYEGFSYVKIYNKNANRRNMLNNLMNLRQIDRNMMVCSGKEENIRKHGSDFDSIIKTLKKSYEPFIWSGS